MLALLVRLTAIVLAAWGLTAAGRAHQERPAAGGDVVVNPAIIGYLFPQSTVLDPESLRLEARFVRERGLGGLMFWQYDSDPTGALLEALFSGLRTL